MKKCIFFLILLFCIILYSLLKKGAVNVQVSDHKDLEIDIKCWEDFGRSDKTITYDYFINSNQWHYDLNSEMDAACIVADYSNKKMSKKEDWELRCMLTRNMEDHKWISSIFVCSESKRELYILLKGGDAEGDKYAIIADIVRDNSLPVLLGNGDCSYDSALIWNSYQDSLNFNINEHSILIDEDAYIYDAVYIDEGVCAMSDYLSLTNTDSREKWKLMDNMIYIGVNGYLADMWFSNENERVHLVIDIWNKVYTVVEVA